MRILVVTAFFILNVLLVCSWQYTPLTTEESKYADLLEQTFDPQHGTQFHFVEAVIELRNGRKINVTEPFENEHDFPELPGKSVIRRWKKSKIRIFMDGKQ